MRKGEILNLRWTDVDMTRRVVNIQSREGKSPSEYVFSLNDKPIDGGWLTHKFKKCVRDANLADERLHFHLLHHYAEFRHKRHTFASTLARTGVPLFDIQKLLNHSQVSTTMVYSHLMPEHLRASVERLTLSMN
jgi:site-specific recombinase XerD